MVKILQKFGYFDIETAENGIEAIEKVEECDRSPQKIELVFMDMQMPELDGCRASTEIRKRRMNPHIVAMTANAFKEDRDRCLAAGMCDYSSKPVRLEVLETILVTAFECQNGITKCRCSGPGSA